MAFITVGTENSADIDLYYTDQGSGQPVVLIHGFPLNGESWGKQQAALLDAGYRVIAYDRRGFGASTKTGVGLRLRHVRRRPAPRSWRTSTCTTRCSSASRWAPARSPATSARYGSARVAKAAFLGSLEPFLLKTDDNPDGAGPQEFFDGIAAVGARRTATPSSAASTRTSTTSTTTSARASRRRRSTPACRSANQAGNAAIAAAPLTWPTDFRADIPHDRRAGAHPARHRRQHPADRRDRPPLQELLPDATYVEIEGAPHGLLWTHADEVNEALLAFLKS